MNIKSWDCDFQGHKIRVEVGLERARLYLDGKLADEAKGLLFRLFDPSIDLSGRIRNDDGTSCFVQALVRRRGIQFPVLACRISIDATFYLSPQEVENAETVGFLLEAALKAGLGALGGALAGAILGLGTGLHGGARLVAEMGATVGAIAGVGLGLGRGADFPPELPEDVRLARYVLGQRPEDENDLPQPRRPSDGLL